MEEIEKLLVKYFDGNTSLNEENRLRDYFKSKDIPKHLIEYKNMFDFYSTSRSEKINDNNFDVKILDAIGNNKVESIKSNYRKIWYAVAGIAASIIIFFVAYFQFFQHESIHQITDEEQFAYTESINALIMVSEALNMTSKEMEKFSVISEAFQPLEKLSYYEKYNNFVFKYLGAGS